MDENMVIHIIAEQMHISANELNEDTELADLGADSLDLFQIISAMEEAFDLEIDGEQAEKLKTIGDIIGFTKVALEK